MVILLILIAIVVALTVIVALEKDGSIYVVDPVCQSDIPCQECGKCYGDHIGLAFSNHSYVYPRDLHR